MPDNAIAIRDLYRDGLQEIGQILGSPDSTPAQRKVAEQSLDDLTAMMLAHEIETVQGRTALLAGLIVELNQVTDAIRVEPKLLGIAKKLDGIAKKASKLLSGEKKGLLTGGAG